MSTVGCTAFGDVHQALSPSLRDHGRATTDPTESALRLIEPVGRISPSDKPQLEAEDGELKIESALKEEPPGCDTALKTEAGADTGCSEAGADPDRTKLTTEPAAGGPDGDGDGPSVCPPPQKEIVSCDCDVKNEVDVGPVYCRLGSAATLEELRQQLAEQTGFSTEQVRLETVRYTGHEGKTEQGCPIAKWVLRRRDDSEQLLAVAKRRPGHRCRFTFLVLMLVVWDALAPRRADTLYSSLVERLNRSATPTRRGCGANRPRTCMCQGLDSRSEGASFSFGCSYSMYFNACKFARSHQARKFRLNHPDQEAPLEQELQELATEMAPLYRRVAPVAYQNQVRSEQAALECRLGLAPGRPWSGVTACLDFCAHAHRDIHNTRDGCTAVLTLLKPRASDVEEPLPGQGGPGASVGQPAAVQSGTQLDQTDTADGERISQNTAPAPARPTADPAEGADSPSEPPDEQLHVLPLYVLEESGEEQRDGVQRLHSYPVEIRRREVPLATCTVRRAAKRPLSSRPGPAAAAPGSALRGRVSAAARPVHWPGLQEALGSCGRAVVGWLGGEPGALSELQPGAGSGGGSPSGWSPQGSAWEAGGTPQRLLTAAHWTPAAGRGVSPLSGYRTPETYSGELHSPQPQHTAPHWSNGSSPLVPAGWTSAGVVSRSAPIYPETPALPRLSDPALYPGTPALSRPSDARQPLGPAAGSARTAPGDGRDVPGAPAVGPARQQGQSVLPGQAVSGSPGSGTAGGRAEMDGAHRSHSGTPESPTMASNGHTPYSPNTHTFSPGTSHSLPFILNSPVRHSPLPETPSAPLDPTMAPDVPHSGSWTGAGGDRSEAGWDRTEASGGRSGADWERTEDGVRVRRYQSDCSASFSDRRAGGVAVALTHGSLLLECAVDELHATTALRRPDRRRPSRLSLVFYQHKGLQRRRHGWITLEERRRQREERRRQREEGRRAAGADRTAAETGGGTSTTQTWSTAPPAAVPCLVTGPYAPWQMGYVAAMAPHRPNQELFIV
ncbi:DNA N6-methyl adenine demethylase-like [Amphibalanus amphitrite]|uniref:DNA N6-methyl adenine demethylase-like n=1 Tax=Amphibalanus amphitrite TaxID=1232801 RepID=UPI001C92883D|nr:DNA N6-methyl adenine demethylase-like [Amphibalanus amphitrite]